MENLEISAKTVEEAIKKALTQLNVGLEEIDVTVLTQGRGGILGLGAEDAKISVKLRQVQPVDGNKDIESAEDIESARKILQDLLELMGVEARIEVGLPDEMTDEDGEPNPAVLNVVDGDLAVLIGRRGQTIDALQYLLRLILSKQTKSKFPVMVDVENYKQRRYEDLRTLALNVASQVKVRRTAIRLEPMPAFERRIVHTTLANDPEVTTESIGDGDSRKVVVMLKGMR
jgi:spoIIIJ-associated protein